MPAPLIWLGAGLLGAYTAGRLSRSAQNAGSAIAVYPGESDVIVRPVDGAIVCCGIYGMFEHTGIWLDGAIIELSGKGLVRGISAQRFLHNRSGSQIHILCDHAEQPLVASGCVDLAASKLFQYSHYHLLNNNCHRFVWQCLNPDSRRSISSFYELNQALLSYFDCRLYWQQMADDA